MPNDAVHHLTVPAVHMFAFIVHRLTRPSTGALGSIFLDVSVTLSLASVMACLSQAMTEAFFKFFFFLL